MAALVGNQLVDGLRLNGRLLMYGEDDDFHEQSVAVGKPHCEHLGSPLGYRGVGVRSRV